MLGAKMSMTFCTVSDQNSINAEIDCSPIARLQRLLFAHWVKLISLYMGCRKICSHLYEQSDKRYNENNVINKSASSTASFRQMSVATARNYA
jgi:hypothetical protein